MWQWNATSSLLKPMWPVQIRHEHMMQIGHSQLAPFLNPFYDNCCWKLILHTSQWKNPVNILSLRSWKWKINVICCLFLSHWWRNTFWIELLSRQIWRPPSLVFPAPAQLLVSLLPFQDAWYVDVHQLCVWSRIRCCHDKHGWVCKNYKSGKSFEYNATVTPSRKIHGR